MREFVRGQRSKISALTPSSELLVGVAVAAESDTVFDVSCFGVDAYNTLSDDRYFIFYNQRSSPEDAIAALGPEDGDAEVFRADLSALPPAVRRLAFAITIDGEGTMSEILRGHLRLLADGEEVVRYPFTGADFGEEKALIVADIYHKNTWRFAAVGQGFKGDLRALLRYFGGEEAGEPSATPAPPPAGATPPAAATPPPPPTSPPVRVERGELQRSIDAAAPGATLSLARDEYQGPIRIDKPLIVEGNGSVVWTRRGPVLTVNARGVRLRGLDLEVTVVEGGTGKDDVALEVTEDAGCDIAEVSVRGRVVGLGAQSGGWRLPPALDLGTFAPRAANTFVFGVSVPVACVIESGVAGLTVAPDVLEPGEHEVTLTARDVGAETLISGRLEVRSEELSRLIPVTGGTVGGAGTKPVSRVRLFG